MTSQQNQQHIEKRVNNVLINAIQEKIRKTCNEPYYITLFKTFQQSDILKFKHQYHAIENQNEKDVQRVWETLIPKEFLHTTSNQNTKKHKKTKTNFWRTTFYNQLKDYPLNETVKTLYCTRSEEIDYDSEHDYPIENYYVLGMRDCGDWFLMVVEDCLVQMFDEEEIEDENWNKISIETWDEDETRMIEKFYTGMSAKEYEELPTKIHLYTHTSLETLLFSIPSEYIKRLQLQKDVLKISKPVTTILNAEVGIVSACAEETQDCPICMDALTTETQIKLSCGHLFCNPCIMKSIKTAKTTKKSENMLTSCCPMCRGSVQAEQKSSIRLTQKLDKWCKKKHHLRLKLQGYQTVHRGRKT
jgi:regulation of enolase protein 1 (concanavalin A-like superfamily)